MLRVLLVLILSIFFACSQDRPAPVAPAGKATDFEDLFGAFNEVQQAEAEANNEVQQAEAEANNEVQQAEAEANNEVQQAEAEANKPPPAPAMGFNIEIIFQHSFREEQKIWIKEIAAQWEPFFYDMDDVVLPSGDVIDDIRILVGRLTPQRAAQMSRLETWSDLTIYGITQVELYRPNGDIPLIVRISINEDAIDKSPQTGDFNRQLLWRKIFHHELGHAFGIGPSPAWKRNVEWFGDVPLFVGANAKRESIILEQLEYPNPVERYDPRGIRLEGGGLTRADRPSPHHWLWIGWDQFKIYYIQDNQALNMSAITLGAFEDIGWLVSYELAGAPLSYSLSLHCGLRNGYKTGTMDDFRICSDL